MASSSTAACATVFRFFASATPRRCPQCLRTFSSYRSFRQSSKRQLMTESAYRPQTLDPPPPPPRNADVPDPLLAGGTASTTDQRFTWSTSEPQKQTKSEKPASSYSVAEREAQTSQPVTPSPQSRAQPSTSSAANASTNSQATPQKRKLRPRKAAMTLTPAAVSQLRNLLNDPEPKLIRVGVKNKGCSGSAYHLEYVDKPGKFDEQVEQDGVKVLIDSKALIKVIGSEMDWVEDKLSSRFTFRNPNVTEQCGCGESFSVS
ncbi:uncharacterized protein PV09_07318 [Verruconis gallopava]|uniref:Iron-sulfur assembly protein 1 n=1 Tax=Verruconis gallopava TaxID=253628 RepID=A0A0D2AQ33_9PEZI|nr:uncharacterized protein PV09_07318 [Verruconis gallopava]KIW01279.1 hypothetical protein PV09_07318 [Verruconis gallopava]